MIHKLGYLVVIASLAGEMLLQAQAEKKVLQVKELSEIKNLDTSKKLSNLPAQTDKIQEKVSLCTKKVQEPKKIDKKKYQERTVFVANNITKDMITYKKHWTGHYTPSTFVFKINDKEIKHEETTAVTVIDDIVQLTFNYEFKVFGKVQRAGEREIKVKVPKNLEKITTTFSWDSPENIIVNGGCEVISCKDLT